MVGIQMDGDSPRSEVIDPQDTADDISAHGIEDQDLPDRISIFIQYGSTLGDEASGP